MQSGLPATQRQKPDDDGRHLHQSIQAGIPIDDPSLKNDAKPDADLSGDDDDELKDIENIDDGEDSPDNDVDLGGDDDLGVAPAKDDDSDDDN